MPGLPVQSFRLKNFKAVRDSGIVRFNRALNNKQPKNKLREIFRNNNVGAYQEHIHNHRIAAVADLNRLRRCSTFREFDTRVLP